MIIIAVEARKEECVERVVRGRGGRGECGSGIGRPLDECVHTIHNGCTHGTFASLETDTTCRMGTAVAISKFRFSNFVKDFYHAS